MVMKIMLAKAKRDKVGKWDLMQKAYETMIDNYKSTIMFLEANK